MTSQKNTTRVALEPANIDRIQMLCGPFDDNLKQIEKRLSVSIDYNLNEFEITGSDSGCNAAKTVLQKLYVDTAPIKGEAQDITPTQVNLALVESRILDQNDDDNDEDNPYSVQYGKEVNIKTKKGVIKPRTPNQAQYVKNIVANDITFGIGPAGSGKTYLAVAAAVDAPLLRFRTWPH